jgi:hypothetical protein
MASLNGYYNEDDKPSEGFDVLPAGDYLAAIVDSELKRTKSGTGEYLKLVWEIMEGDYKDRKLFENLNLQNPSPKAQEIARGQFSAIRRATGVEKPNDSAELHNIPVILKVGLKKDDTGTMQNVIKKYSNRNGETATKPASATPGAVPPWKQKV